MGKELVLGGLDYLFFLTINSYPILMFWLRLQGKEKSPAKYVLGHVIAGHEGNKGEKFKCTSTCFVAVS